jgi:Xaa-Pro aminopeptidase
MKPIAALLPCVLGLACIFVYERDELVAPGPWTGAGPIAGEEPIALARRGDGQPVCGLGQEFHAGRRKDLMQRVGPELLFFRGLPEPRENLAFRQDKNFWYLTGIESPDAALLLDGKTGKEILFLPPRDLASEGWAGELWDCEDAWVEELTGFTDVRSSEELLEVLEDELEGRAKVGTNLSAAIPLSGSYDAAISYERRQEQDPLDGRVSREKALAAKLKERFDVEVFDVYEHLVEMRWVKQPEEIAAMRRAARAGALAHVEAMRSTRPGIGEWELDALMSFVQVREGASGKAYEAIVGSARNACILHYVANSRRMQKGEVVLIDYGPELDHYTTDITRSWPTDGRFTERAAELYDAVLAAQKAGIAAARPGVTIREVDAACTAVLKERGFHQFRRHGACHYIGMEVHDPGPNKPVVPGVAFTIEPGLYDTENGIGIRIEDVVVITNSGCEVLSLLAPKEREQVEKLLQEQGVLDWLERGE